MMLALALVALTPSAELSARLAELEQQRTLIARQRDRASTIHLAAGPVYGLALASAAWAIIERVKVAQNPSIGPLGGQPFVSPISPGVLFACAAGFAVMGIALNVYAGSLNLGASEDEQELNDEERMLKRSRSP